MRKLLNVLYVTSPKAYIKRDGENIVIFNEQTETFRIPAHNLEGIVTFGYMGASPGAMHLCTEKGIALSFLKENGEFIARVQGKVSGNVLLRRKQYRLADNEEECARLASRFIAAKVSNSRAVLNRGIRDHREQVDHLLMKQTSDTLKHSIAKVMRMNTLEDVRGVEGDVAKRYFGAMNELILTGKEAFYMRGRNRRPPRDRMNALLSYLYMFLMLETQSALETVGLDPAVGFLHRDRPGRASLALDVMEELRAYMVDRLALSLVNRKQIQADDFMIQENEAVILKKDARKQVIAAWQERKQTDLVHPYLQEKMKIGLLPYVQSLLLARHIRGDLDDYPPFLWK
ncbi:type I-C CRISPR-associated endonuclease Cas1c [Paenibacillus profundus]|uniref:CRISPR-associated endonuclease Cas1 n=1 Tax=Paenibacillus profundus TaxID=1173085 RepID=A0ABS8YRC4_9BACL|nr:type I-C CRISPR-associated endonuclease Cas1c [Paenibacillus profundus]MCE5173524.1 type I-C CRISPR-associated endonuclease Cas1c [Paenibacillus profundus]